MWESRSSPAFFVFVLGWRTYCVSCATHVVGTYWGRPPRTFELASLYLHPAKHKKVFLLRIDTHPQKPVGQWARVAIRNDAHMSMWKMNRQFFLVFVTFWHNYARLVRHRLWGRGRTVFYLH